MAFGVFADDFAAFGADFAESLSDLGRAFMLGLTDALEFFLDAPCFAFDAAGAFALGDAAVFTEGRFEDERLATAAEGRVVPATVFASSNETIFACPANGILLPQHLGSFTVCSMLEADRRIAYFKTRCYVTSAICAECQHAVDGGREALRDGKTRPANENRAVTKRCRRTESSSTRSARPKNLTAAGLRSHALAYASIFLMKAAHFLNESSLIACSIWHASSSAISGSMPRFLVRNLSRSSWRPSTDVPYS